MQTSQNNDINENVRVWPEVQWRYQYIILSELNVAVLKPMADTYTKKRKKVIYFVHLVKSVYNKKLEYNKHAIEDKNLKNFNDQACSSFKASSYFLSFVFSTEIYLKIFQYTNHIN